MTTSGSVDFKVNMSSCIDLALQLINVKGEEDYTSDYDYNIAKMHLNMMLKSWQNQDNHLWLKKTASLFLQNNQSQYSLLLSGGTDMCTTDDVVETSLSVAAAIGATTLTVASTTGMTNGDYIGVIQDNDPTMLAAGFGGTYLHWSTISNVVSSTSVAIVSPLTGIASIGRKVVSFTNLLITPFQVYSAVRHNFIDKTDIPLIFFSYDDYFKMVYKQARGVPTAWSYDRQRDAYYIHAWQTPQSADDYFKLIISRKVQDMDNSSDDFDLPQEWEEAIVYNLAVRIAPHYGKAQGENFNNILLLAKQLEAEVLGFDNELGSIFMKPSRDGYRR